MKRGPKPDIDGSDRIKWGSIVTETGCWEWQGCIGTHGYGKLKLGGRALLAHRLSYERFRGAIPEGLEVDHQCNNRRCVNPWHLEPATRLQNASRTHKTHCKYGHLKTGVDCHGYLRCMECDRIKHRRAA